MNGFIIYINEPRSISLSKVKLKHFINETDIDVSLFKGVHRKNAFQTWIDSNFKLFDAQSFGTGQIDVEFAVFFSHYNLWMKCLELNESILILEHDATICNEINLDLLKSFNGDILNLGAPSWGSHIQGNWPNPWLLLSDGIRKRPICKNKHDVFDYTNKNHCPCDSRWLYGAQSYVITPQGAKKLIDGIEEGILPADIYIRQELVDIYDYLPHPIKQESNFTLVQLWGKKPEQHNY